MKTRFYTTESIGPTRDTTPEGYLLCRDVPIARTGTMDYAPGEVPIDPGIGLLIRIERRAEEVFRQNTIDSFAGKPVCDDHPPEDVTPANWRNYAVGVVQNPRRGDGAFEDCLVADLLITDADAIEAVLSGKREVSCGYDAEYYQIEPGRGEQRNIVGNHVALVDRGRCGPRCSIGDSKMAAKKRTVWDKVKTAFKANDAEALEEALEEAQKEMAPKDADPEGDPKHVQVHVHNYPNQPKDETADPKVESEADPAKDEGEDNQIAAVVARLDALEQTCAALAEKVAKMEAGERAEAEANGLAQDEDPDAEKEDEDDKVGTADAAALTAEFREVVAAAEILSPGISVPTFDAAKTGRRAANDALCALRRRALSDAAKTAEGKAAIDAVVSPRLNLKGMTCDAVTVAFNATATAMRAAKNSGTFRGGAAVQTQPVNLREINRDFWSKQTAR